MKTTLQFCPFIRRSEDELIQKKKKKISMLINFNEIYLFFSTLLLYVFNNNGICWNLKKKKLNYYSNDGQRVKIPW